MVAPDLPLGRAVKVRDGRGLQCVVSAFSPGITLVMRMGITTVQEGQLDVYNRAACIIKTPRDPFIQNFDVNMSNYLIMKVFTES